MLSCGFDAEVVRRLHGRRGTRGGGHISYWSYLKPILQSIRSYGCPELRIDCDPPCGGVQGKAGRPFLARWAFLFNLPRYAWGLPLAPEAVGHDGWMELYTFAHGTFFHGLWYAACAQAGWHSRLPDCARRRVRRVRIAAQQPVPYQLDGDPAGELPVEVEVQPGRVTLLVPRTYSSRSA
jgi:diacylglycerol kinase family enzyme